MANLRISNINGRCTQYAPYWKNTLYKLFQSGNPLAGKIGGKWQIRVDDLKDYLVGKFRRN